MAADPSTVKVTLGEEKKESKPSAAPEVIEKTPEQLAEEKRVEAAKYQAMLDVWNSQESVKNKPQRTGWTKIDPNYKILCWGSSIKDWILISLCFTILYALLVLFYYAMLEFYMVNVTDATALYIFFACLFVAAGALGLTVHWGNQERAAEEARLAAEKAAAAEAAVAAARKQ